LKKSGYSDNHEFGKEKLPWDKKTKPTVQERTNKKRISTKQEGLIRG